MRNQFIITKTQSGFAAIGGPTGDIEAPTTTALRARIRQWQETANVDDDDLRFASSSTIQPLFPACERCDGTMHVEADYPSAQYLTNEYDAVDLSLSAKTMCPECRGLGLEVPGFGHTDTPNA